MRNSDDFTVAGFGQEWSAYDQSKLDSDEAKRIFTEYFHIFPWQSLPDGAVGFDLGCGSGRWAALVAPRVGHLHCVDASEEALGVARRNLRECSNISFHHASVDERWLPDGSSDFGYSLGVLHHVPDTEAAIASCVAKLKEGAPLLLYLYYRFDNRPFWFRMLWRCSDLLRRMIATSPFAVRLCVTRVAAAVVYWPLARFAGLLARLGFNASNWPLSYYAKKSFYVMQTDALDRFGTHMEHRFTRGEIERMLKNCGLVNILFSNHAPFWCVIAYKPRSAGAYPCAV